MRGSSALRFPPPLLPSLPLYRSHWPERAFKFRKSREIYSGTDCLFYPISRIRVLSDHLRSFHLRGNFILGFRISSIPSASIRFLFLPFFFFRPTTRCRFHPATLRGLTGNRVIYPALKIERPSSGFLVNRHCYVTRRESPP